MDLDELIRTELASQAAQAPDPHAVLAGVPARARVHRQRRLALAASAAVAATVVAVGVPYAIRHGQPATTAAAAHQSVALGWGPGWEPAGLTETNREVGPGTVSGRYTDFARNITQGVDWQVGNANLGLPAADKRTPVRVGRWTGFWDDSTPDGMARLYFRVQPDLWAFVGVTNEWTADPRGVALRFGASLHQGDRSVDVPVRFDWLPAGVTMSPGINAGSTGSADAWAARWNLAGPGGGVSVTVARGTLARYAYPGVDDLGPDATRRPVRVGDRTGYWVTADPGAPDVSPGRVPLARSQLEVPLANGETLVLRAQATKWPISEADLVRIAASAVPLQVDYSWMG